MSISFTSPGSDWAAAIVAKLKAKNPEITGVQETRLIEFWTCICDAHETFIQDALLVTTKSNGQTEVHTAGQQASIINLPGTSA